MGRLRSYYDADRTEKFIHPTAFKTERNNNEIFCGFCGETFFIDDILFEETTRIIERTLENPFLCEDCFEEYNELAYGHQH